MKEMTREEEIRSNELHNKLQKLTEIIECRIQDYKNEKEEIKDELKELEGDWEDDDSIEQDPRCMCVECTSFLCKLC